METTLLKVREMIDANTIVGKPVTTVDGITLIPVSKLSFGFAGGGTDGRKQETKDSFGGGVGVGVKVEPVAFIIVKDENVRMLHVSPPPSTTLDRVIETVPEVMDKISDLFGKQKKEEDD